MRLPTIESICEKCVHLHTTRDVMVRPQSSDPNDTTKEDFLRKQFRIVFGVLQTPKIFGNLMTKNKNFSLLCLKSVFQLEFSTHKLFISELELLNKVTTMEKFFSPMHYWQKFQPKNGFESPKQWVAL